MFQKVAGLFNIHKASEVLWQNTIPIIFSNSGIKACIQFLDSVNGFSVSLTKQ